MKAVVTGVALTLLIAGTIGRGEDYLTPAGAPGSDETRMRTLNEIEPRTIIAKLPFAVTNPGSYSVVTPLRGEAGACGITISCGNVRLDLNGFPIRGVTNSLDGILVTVPCDNITIRNGVVGDWGRYGVNATNAKDVVFADLKAYGNGSGGLYAGDSALIERCSAYGNGMLATNGYPPADDGITTGPYSTILQCKARRNKGAGIHTYNHSRVIECTATESMQANGVSAEDYCTVKDCTVSQNAFHGIRIGSKCRAEGNTCGENHNAATTNAAGISVEGANNLVERNILCGNDYGLYVQPGAQGNLIIHNAASKNIFDYKIQEPNNYIGPLEQFQGGSNFTNMNPWANFRFSTYGP